MERNWTADQRKVIESRGKNILVSAAAGSGKTAVLTERVIRMVEDAALGIDVDDILVVTFTRAAAAEMKEKIARALEERLEADPKNERLRRQSVLVQAAQISTTDSFCGYVVNNYFQTIGLEPGFRTGDEDEFAVLKQDILTEVMDGEYARQEETFQDLVSAFGKAKGDAAIREMVLTLTDYAQSYPDERGYLERLADAYEGETLAALPWFDGYFADIRYRLKDAAALLGEAYDTAVQHGIEKACLLLETELEQIEGILEADGYDALRSRVERASFQTFPGSIKKSFAGDPEIVEGIKQRRDAAKSLVAELKKSLGASEQEHIRILKDAAVYARALSALSLAFYDRLREEKFRRKTFSFSDIAHFALEILSNPETGEPKPPAYDFGARFREIMTDEYQDTNYVQERIFRAITDASEGRCKLFMVGDVKQSIYGFRQARPEIFMEKAKRFGAEAETAGDVLIALSKNFRSAHCVIESVNRVFSGIMQEDLGGIAYDDVQKLYQGAPEPETDRDLRSELLIADAQMEKPEAEARIIADRILRLKEQGYQNRDIVILSASTKYIAATLLKVLADAGIDAFLTRDEGYFDAVEVKVLLGFLETVSNPRIDIPLAGTLCSPLFGFSETELAQIRLLHTNDRRYLFDDLTRYGESGEDAALRARVQDFLAQLSDYRDRALDLGLRELLELVLKKSGYLDVLAVKPAGARRLANVNMLLERAGAFERAGRGSVYGFIRYIETMKSYHIDTGQADTASEEDDVVRVMTIHKSKGLEFPVVFLTGMHRAFHHAERSPVLCDMDYGAALPAVYKKRHLKIRTIFDAAMQEKNRSAQTAERMRLLYVAMTRAKEKLIMTGAAKEKSLQKSLDKFRGGGYNARRGVNSFLDCVYSTAYEQTDLFQIRMFDDAALEGIEAQIAGREALRAADILSAEADADEALIGELRGRINYVYPYAAETVLAPKVSVSELKHREADEEALYLFDEEKALYVPRFVQTEDAAQERGTAYGSAIHRLMEYLRYDGTPVQEQIDALVARGFLKPEEGAAIRVFEAETYLASPLGQAAGRAWREHRLYRERAFSMQIAAREAYPGVDSGEPVLVQGVIDAYFFEGDEAVLLDYKSDFVRGKKELLDRYALQLALYGRALEASFGKTVGHRYIYSFRLGEVIEV